jgi:aspartate-semialdehyde dehydrogenase
VAGRFSNAFFVVRSVNVDEALVRVRVLGIETVQPKDSRHYQILVPHEFFRHLHAPAVFEHGSQRHSVANLFRDAEPAGRRFHAPLFRPETKSGSRNWVRPQFFLSRFQREPLLAHRDVDLCLRAFLHLRLAVGCAVPKTKGYHIAVVGATGAVGVELLGVLERRGFPVERLLPLSSDRSAGKIVSFRNNEIAAEELSPASFEGIDLAFFSAGGDISRRYAPIARAAGAIVIDNSSVFRMEPDVPLVIPEINGEDIQQHSGLIANPNCTTAVALMALYPLHMAFGVRRVFAASYQAVSGSGARAISELRSQVEAAAAKKMPLAEVYPHPIAFNVLPHVDSFLPSGYTKEEMKMQNEGRRIMHLPQFRASVTCVRVPVYRAHSVAVSAEFERPVSVAEAHEALAKAPGLELVDEPQKNSYPMPLYTAGKDNCEVGRVRLDCALENGLSFWVSGDQLLKGAALNAVQIAELL